MTDIEYKYYLIELIPRVFCGIIFLFQGYDKLFKVKIQGVVEAFLFETQHRYVPKFLLQGMAVFASNVEFIGGALLIVGLFKTAVSYLGHETCIPKIDSYLDVICNARPLELL
jgi:putative oxidoreductase